MPKLVIKPGTPQAQEFELKPGKNYIGRGFANDFKLEDASVSGTHALIEVNGGVVTVTDLGSTNGTRINGLPATGNPLQSGQVLKFGALELLYVADAATPAAPAVASPPPASAAAQIATEFIIREPSRVGVAPAAPPPPAPLPPAGELRIPVAAPLPPPPATMTTSPAPLPPDGGLRIPVAPTANLASPPPVMPAPTPITQTSGLKTPSPPAAAPAASSPPPPPVIAAPVSVPLSSEVKSPNPAPSQPTAPPPTSFTATSVAEAPLPLGAGSRFSNIAQPPPPVPIMVAPPAPTAVESAASPVPAEAIEAPPGKTVCKFHKNTPGQWLCQKCDQLFCSLCVSTRPTPAGVGYFCRSCGTQCAQVKVKIIAKKQKTLTTYTDATILLRILGFGSIATVACAGVWILFAALVGFPIPGLFMVASGAACGYAIKIASQDRPGGLFVVSSIGFYLLTVIAGEVGTMLVAHMLGLGIATYAGFAGGIFLAWKIGGGDF